MVCITSQKLIAHTSLTADGYCSNCCFETSHMRFAFHFIWSDRMIITPISLKSFLFFFYSCHCPNLCMCIWIICDCVRVLLFLLFSSLFWCSCCVCTVFPFIFLKDFCSSDFDSNRSRFHRQSIPHIQPYTQKETERKGNSKYESKSDSDSESENESMGYVYKWSEKLILRTNDRIWFHYV